jgi:3-deoxy-manno-octulosonate cytidylyltransferase (CMP-KDO synthetase)
MEEWLDHQSFWGHIGVYGYRHEVLSNYCGLPISQLQGSESLEQLRFLEAGYIFRTLETNYRSVAVDTPADLEKVRKLLIQTA